MSKITITNTFCQLKNAEPIIISSVAAGLTVKADGYWFNPKYKKGLWDGTVSFFDKRNNTFLTGLLPVVLDILDSLDEEVILSDKRTGLDFLLETEDFVDPVVLQYSGKTLRDYQNDSIKNIINSQLENLPWQRGILNLATNAGKTTVAEAVIQMTYPKLCDKYRIRHSDGSLEKIDPVFMFLTHSKEIAYQAKQSFESDLGIPVGIVGDGKWDVQPVTIAMTPTLYARLKGQKPEFFETTKRVVAFVADELHHASSEGYNAVLQNLNNAALRLGLTGTVPDTKNADKLYKVKGVTGDIIKKVSNNYLIKHGYSAKPECYMVPVEYPDVDSIRLYGRQDEYGDLEYGDIYQKGVVSNMWRNYIIAKICEKEVKENQGQVLILVERIEHGECIQECLDYIGCDLRYLFLNGELDSATRQQGLMMLKNGDLDVVISTAILDEGVDVPNINALIYARGMKSTRKLLQGIGRGLRKKQDGSNLRMYDFIDYTAEILGSQSLQRMEILSKEKFSIKQKTPEDFLGISEAEFQSVMSDLDTTYDSKYVNV